MAHQKRRNTDLNDWPKGWSDIWPFMGSALVVIALLAVSAYLIGGPHG